MISFQKDYCSNLLLSVLKSINDWLFSKVKTQERDIDTWLQAELFDINGDFERMITNIDHPNNRLLLNSDRKEGNEVSYLFRKGDEPIHPEHGVIFRGDYKLNYNSANLFPTVGLFNPTGFTILMRAFCEVGSRTVIVFGNGFRWFTITPTGMSLNNENENDFCFAEGLKMGEWNDIYISYNNAQLPGTFTESSAVFNHPNPNAKREILCIVNGKEEYFNIDNINIEMLTEEDACIQSETEMLFINYSCGHTFKGFFSSLILFNQSCTSTKELEWLASTFLRYHNKPTLTYQEVLNKLE